MSYADLRKGRVSLRGQSYILTTVTAERRPFFADLYVARDVVSSLRAHDARGDTRTFAFVIMPDHVHWLVQLAGNTSLTAIMKRFKGATAHHVNSLLGRSGAVWQPSFHDHAVRDDECLASAARYVIMNPVRAGLVEHIGDYALWDSVYDMSECA